MCSCKPSWDEAPYWANYLAQDEDCYWSWYEKKPIKGNDGRFRSEGRYEILELYNPDWDQTLEERTKEIKK